MSVTDEKQALTSPATDQNRLLNIVTLNFTPTDSDCPTISSSPNGGVLLKFTSRATDVLSFRRINEDDGVHVWARIKESGTTYSLVYVKVVDDNTGKSAAFEKVGTQWYLDGALTCNDTGNCADISWTLLGSLRVMTDAEFAALAPSISFSGYTCSCGPVTFGSGDVVLSESIDGYTISAQYSKTTDYLYQFRWNSSITAEADIDLATSSACFFARESDSDYPDPFATWSHAFYSNAAGGCNQVGARATVTL